MICSVSNEWELNFFVLQTIVIVLYKSIHISLSKHWLKLKRLSSNFAGDVAFRILETINSVDHGALQDVLEDNLHEDTQIYVCDINPNMLNVGKKRAQERGKVCELNLTLSKSSITLWRSRAEIFSWPFLLKIYPFFVKE